MKYLIQMAHNVPAIDDAGCGFSEPEPPKMLLLYK